MFYGFVCVVYKSISIVWLFEACRVVGPKWKIEVENKRYRISNGFTLIELVIVVIVLAVLAAVALPKFINVQRDAKIATLSGIAGRLEDQSKIAHLKVQLDNIPISDDCSYDCNGHPNWDGSMAAGHYFIMTADGTKLYLRWGYPLYSGNTTSVTNINFKSAMGLNDSEFVFVEGGTLKIIPQNWENKLADIKDNNFKCYLEYWNSVDTGGNEIIVHSEDC